MSQEKSILQALRNEYAAVGIDLSNTSDSELQQRIVNNIDGFKGVQYNDEICTDIDQLASEYQSALKKIGRG
ncbi:hypothetical protein AB1283_00810 [Bacillus sp. S13(2024)]|uniref:hypothetical protein n=1 Tax=Bacillus sp. S13(2024) TaxID=3162885 RepID=UPI003D1925DA